MWGKGVWNVAIREEGSVQWPRSFLDLSLGVTNVMIHRCVGLFFFFGNLLLLLGYDIIHNFLNKKVTSPLVSLGRLQLSIKHLHCRSEKSKPGGQKPGSITD